METAVFNLALALGGREEDSHVLLPLCTAAVEELTARLRPELTPGDCGTAFQVAAAWLALEAMGDVGGGMESFSAGDVTVKPRSGDTLIGRVERMMAPYLQSREFAFMGVRG